MMKPPERRRAIGRETGIGASGLADHRRRRVKIRAGFVRAVRRQQCIDHRSRPSFTLAYLMGVAMVLGGIFVDRAIGAAEERSESQKTIVVVREQSELRAGPGATMEGAGSVNRHEELIVTGAPKNGMWPVETGGTAESWIPEADVGLRVERDGSFCVELSLEKAIDLGAIHNPIITGTESGDFEGDSIVFRATGALEIDVCLRIIPGMVLKSTNSSETQRMVVRRVSKMRTGPRFQIATEIVFELNSEAEYLLEAYCLEEWKDVPSGFDRFLPEGTAGPALSDLLSLGGDFDTEELGDYIWIIEKLKESREEAEELAGMQDLLRQLKSVETEDLNSIREGIGEIESVRGFDADEWQSMKDILILFIESEEEFDELIKEGEAMLEIESDLPDPEDWEISLYEEMPGSVWKALSNRSDGMGPEEFVKAVISERQELIDLLK